MSISAIERMLRRHARTCFWAAVGCGLLALLYSPFSHGVSSPYLTLLFLWPLGLSLFWAVCAALGRFPGLWCGRCFGASTATCATGSFLKGVLSIAGTSSPWCRYFFWVGGLWAAAGILLLLKGTRHGAHGPSHRANALPAPLHASSPHVQRHSASGAPLRHTDAGAQGIAAPLRASAPTSTKAPRIRYGFDAPTALCSAAPQHSFPETLSERRPAAAQCASTVPSFAQAASRAGRRMP